MIRIKKPRNCIFTNNPANAPLNISHYKDIHNPCKKVPSCSDYLEFRSKYMCPELFEVETQIFLEYWRIESELSVKNAKKIDMQKLQDLQNVILDMMAKVKSPIEIDFISELEKRMERLLQKKFEANQ